jgi:hypothetical protein
VLDRVQCEVLIDFQAFLALMARDELDLRIRQTRMTPEDLRALTPLIYTHVTPYGMAST